MEFAQSAARLILQAPLMGYDGVTGGELWRSPQQAIWDALHGTGVAHSLHTERLAIDLNFFKNGELITDGALLIDMGLWWEALGPQYRWGGRFTTRPDGNHFSISPDGIRA